MECYEFTLPNGIRCIHKRVAGHVSHCALTIGSGSRDERPGEEGLAHFAEHGLFKGTMRRRAHHINCRLENLGGELNAYTTKEETVVHATTLREDFAAAAELIADVAFNSTFPEKEMETERAVILDEINSYKDSPQDNIWDEFEDMIFAGSPLGHNILGTKARVGRYTGRDIAAFVARTYNADHMVFSSVGPATERRFRDTAARYLGEARPPVRDFGRMAPEPQGSFGKTIRRNTHQAHCIIGVRTMDAYDPRRISFSLLTNILGGPAANSILNIALREKNGLTYNIEAGNTHFSDTGLATIYFSSDKERTDECMEIIGRELEKLRTIRLTDRKLSMAKRQLIGQVSISMEGNEGCMLSAGKSFLLYNKVESPEEFYKKISAVTAEEIMDRANEAFRDMSTLIYR